MISSLSPTPGPTLPRPSARGASGKAWPRASERRSKVIRRPFASTASYRIRILAPRSHWYIRRVMQAGAPSLMPGLR